MKARAWIYLLIMALNLLWALSTGGRIYLLFFVIMALVFVLALASALLTRATLQAECTLPEPWATRGGEVELLLAIGHRCPLPIAPMLLEIRPPEPGPPAQVRVQSPLMGRSKYSQRLFCPHVGTFLVGVEQVTVSDVFLLFSLRLRPRDATRALLVRPQVRDARPLRFRPGEAENALMARATEDTSAPADTRAWQEGDPLKRVHWKLSARRRELLVRTFEEPLRPDALVLVNCAPIAGDPETAAALRDVLCETAASLVSAQLTEGNPVSLPLLGDTAREISSDNPAQLSAALDALAQETFAGTQAFERVLMDALRRLRRTGAIAVITAHLDTDIADMAVQLRRHGPYMRFYLAHAGPIGDDTETLLSRLEKQDIEVETIALINDFLQDAQDAG